MVDKGCGNVSVWTEHEAVEGLGREMIGGGGVRDAESRSDAASEGEGTGAGRAWWERAGLAGTHI